MYVGGFGEDVSVVTDTGGGFWESAKGIWATGKEAAASDLGKGLLSGAGALWKTSQQKSVAPTRMTQQRVKQKGKQVRLPATRKKRKKGKFPVSPLVIGGGVAAAAALYFIMK